MDWKELRENGGKEISQVSLFALAAITAYYRLRDLNNRNLFLMVLEAGKSKVKVPTR